MIPLILALIALAGISNAVMDITKSRSIWNTSVWKDKKKGWWYRWAGPDSWKNKWKLDSDGNVTKKPRFFLSTTAFVFVTDAWHFFQMVWSTLFIAAIIVAMVTFTAPMWTWWGAPLIVCYLIEFTIIKVIYTGMFTIFYDHIFKANS